MDKSLEGFGYWWQKFLKVSENNMEEGIIVGPQITQLFEDKEFSTKLNSTK